MAPAPAGQSVGACLAPDNVRTQKQRVPMSSPSSPRSTKAANDAKLLAALHAELEVSRGRLTLERRKELAARLLEHSKGDDTFFTRLSKKLQEAGVLVPSVTVEYRNLKVETEALVGAASVATVANVPINFIKRLLRIDMGREARPLTILNSIQGKLVPGRLTLLLGPPSSGKSSLMRALTGRLIPAQGKVSGDIRYNGYSLDEFNILRTAAYVDQIDNHNPNLTVRETLDFAHACEVGLHGARFDVPAELAAHCIASRRLAVSQTNGNNGNGGDNGTGAANGFNGDSMYSNASFGPHRGHGNQVGASQVSATGSDALGGNANGNGNNHPNHHHANDNGNGTSILGSAAGSRFMRGVRSFTHRNDKSLLEKAAPEDEFEKLLREAWGTRVKVDIVMSLLGLSHCAETLVGDQFVRGISGGERKRLTTAEMLVGPANVVMLDEMSTGLDSATLFTVVRWLSQATRALQMTLVASLLQPPPEVFGLFDDVVLITEGRILYHGPVDGAVSHFHDLGFDCPERKDVPSFLLEISTSAGQRQYAGPGLRARFNLPPPDMDAGNAASRAASATSPADLNDGTGAAAGEAGAVAVAGAGEGEGEGEGGVAATTERGAPGAGPGLEEGQKGKGEGCTTESELASKQTSQLGGLGAPRFKPKSLLIGLEEMETAFWTLNSHGKAMAKELQDHPVQRGSNANLQPPPPPPSPPSAPAPAPAAAPPPGPPLVPRADHFALRPVEAILAATKRQTTLVMRDKVLLKGRVMQVIVLGLITGSLFYNQDVSLISSRTYFGACFMSVLFISFGGFPQLPITMELKKVWYKHRAAAFYPSYAQGLAMALSQLPLSAVEATLFSLIMYFMVNFYREPGYFFTFLLVMLSTSLAISSLFRFMACVCPSMVIANAAVGMTFVLLVLTSGFTIVRGSIPAWMIWIYWISPYGYALRALVINEMVSPKWQNEPPPPNTGAANLGDAALQSFDFYTDRKWIWIGVGFLLGFYLFMTAASIISLTYQQPEVPVAQLPDPEEVVKVRRRAEERHAKMMMEKQQRQRKAAPQPESTVVEVRPSSNSKQQQQQPTSRGMPGQQGGQDSGGATGLVISPSSAVLQDFIDISSSLPFTPITLVFQDLKYWVPNPAYSRAAAKAAAAAKGVKGDDGAKEAASGDVEMAEGGTTAPAAAANPAAAAAPAAGGEGGTPLDVAAKERLQLLSGITGFNEPGVLLALMGGSGAGKTTLMDVIAGRKTIGEIGGTITVNGYKADPRAWSRVMGYVEQNDIHSPGQTVIEALQFSARLRLPQSFSTSQVKSYVEEVLEIVDLLPLMSSLVGSPGVSGLSVEARKRLTIAVELVANPSCVFLDEPTSGLDARAAAIVMRAVRNVARNGRTVMVTIHQPSIEIFEAFDNLLLIQRGGFTTYFGPLGRHSAELIDYFMTVPGTPPLPTGFNPATWMLEVTGGSMATVLDRVEVDWAQLYGSSDLAKRNEARAQSLIEQGQEASKPLQVGSRYAMPFGTQTRVLLHKFNLAYWRSPGYNFMRLSLTFVTSFIYAAIYWKEGKVPNPASISNVQNVMGIMFSSSNFLGMTNLMSVMPVVGYERVVFYRERGASMYDPFAYGAAIALVELPYLLAQALIFVPIMYFMIDFDTSAEAFFYYIIMFLETIAFYTIFGQTLVYITPAQAIAQVVGGGFNFLFNVFNGFIITYPDMPKGWRWMNRIVPPTWILYGLGISQLGNDEGEIIYGGDVMSVRAFMKERFGYSYYMRWWVVLIMLSYILVMRVGSIIALKYWNFLRR